MFSMVLKNHLNFVPHLTKWGFWVLLRDTSPHHLPRIPPGSPSSSSPLFLLPVVATTSTGCFRPFKTSTRDLRLNPSFHVGSVDSVSEKCLDLKKDWRDGSDWIFPYRCWPIIRVNQSGKEPLNGTTKRSERTDTSHKYKDTLPTKRHISNHWKRFQEHRG